MIPAPLGSTQEIWWEYAKHCWWSSYFHLTYNFTFCNKDEFHAKIASDAGELGVPEKKKCRKFQLK